ncbi:hypothetical protein V6N11_068553 [Hibiscus sabdariffa]|uniref:DUF2059 domain-containing protein n=1 Tax=Hibiscus sabdariffa TaxID=183260 RepID=A0ABR2PA31_9ROSI
MVLLIQPLLAHDLQIKDITATGLGFVGDAIDTAKDTHSPDDIKNIGGEIQTALESGGRNDKALDAVLSLFEEGQQEKPIGSNIHEVFLIKPEVVKIIASSPEIKSWLVQAFQVYRSLVGDAAVNAKGVASTLADLDVDAIKNMCGHVKEAFVSASLKANTFDVALSPEDEEKAIEFSAFLPMMSIVNDGVIKPEVLKKLASAPGIKSWLDKFGQEYKRFAGGAAVSVEGPASSASFHLDIDEIKMMEERIKEAFQIGGRSSLNLDVEISPVEEVEFIENGFLGPLLSMADAGLIKNKN